jgi:hypothetical protein
MTSREFCYWLQGFFELTGYDARTPLTGEQADLVRRHLALVFKHEIDPSAGPAEVQAALNKIHDGAPSAWLAERPPGGPVLRC